MGLESSAQAQVASQPDVWLAARLGWRLAQVYHTPPGPVSPFNPDEPLPQHIPGASELSKYARVTLLVAQIIHDASALADADGSASVAKIQAFADAAKQGVGDDATRRLILPAYEQLRATISAADIHLGIALDLGRMLADTVLLVESDSPDTFRRQFNPYRLMNAYEWLSDLHEMLPVQASDAVAGSLQTWEAWVSKSGGTIGVADREHVTRALHAQGEMWRRLLSGEKLAEDLLTAQDYRDAGARLLRRFRSLARGFLSSWWFVVVPFVIVVAAAFWAIITFAHSGATATAALIATGAASVGISWKTLAATLGRATAKAEAPLWDAEVQASVVVAATVSPLATREPNWLTQRLNRAIPSSPSASAPMDR